MIIYLDTSALLKLLVKEDETTALAEYLAAIPDTAHIVTSRLSYTELHCATRRRNAFQRDEVDQMCEALTIFDLERQDFDLAARSMWRLRAADSLHLAAALRIGATHIVTYDRELESTAADTGITVNAPGTPTELMG